MYLEPCCMYTNKPLPMPKKSKKRENKSGQSESKGGKSLMSPFLPFLTRSTCHPHCHCGPLPVQPLMLPCRRYYIYRDRLVSFREDSRPNPSHSNTTLRHPNARSTPLKYIISVTKSKKIMYFEYFLSIHQVNAECTTGIVS